MDRLRPTILGTDILIIGRQIYTKSGALDLLGIDSDGNVVIIEVKRVLLRSIPYL